MLNMSGAEREELKKRRLTTMSEHTPIPWVWEHQQASIWTDGFELQIAGCMSRVGSGMQHDMDVIRANAEFIVEACNGYEALETENAALKRDYGELIMAVGNKHEGETRHETALRYILQAEQGSSEASMTGADDE